METNCTCSSCDCQKNGIAETGCCPKFNPEPWDGKEINFNNKLFVKDHVASFLHIPLNFGQLMTRNMAKIEKAGAMAKDFLVLSDEKSMWGSDLYITIDKEIAGAENVRLSGTFLTKVFEGQYKDMGKWIKQMNEFVVGKDKTVKKLYFYYTTCPKCVKAYGKNYVVILAQI